MGEYDDLDVGDRVDLGYGPGVYEVVRVRLPKNGIARYNMEQVDGDGKTTWAEHHIEHAVEAGATVIRASD